jgi:twitching motility protein PilT
MAVQGEIQRILAAARRENASDIHIVAGLPPLFRISGEIVLADLPPLTGEDTKQISYSLLNEEQKKVFERDWQLCCSVFDDKLGRFRVSVYYRTGNPELAIRPVMDHVRTRSALLLPEQVEDFTRLSSGLVLITGPTGTGKTTTMNYMIDLINSERRCKIIAIEDPVEYIHRPKRAVIVQQELYTDVKSFGNALQTVERIVAIFPENQQPQIYSQMANSLQGVIAQRLVPSADRKRRILATELLIVNHAARKNIRDRQLHLLVNVIQMGRKMGMHLMDDSLLELYEAGDITYDTAINYSHDPNEMRKKIHQRSKSSEETS